MDAPNCGPMWSETERVSLERLADMVIPEDASGPAASRTGVATFFERLFDAELQGRTSELRAFLAAPGDTPQDHPFFRTFAEIVHEHYWTSPEGFAAVGFTITA